MWAAPLTLQQLTRFRSEAAKGGGLTALRQNRRLCRMPDAVTVAVALVITLGIFFAVRPLWRRGIGTGHGQAVDNRSTNPRESKPNRW